MKHDFATDAEPCLYIKGGLVFWPDGRIEFRDEPLCTVKPFTFPQIRDWIDHHFPREEDAA